MADVDVGDCLDLLAHGRRTRAILLYLETMPAARKFLSAARAAARVKPVIALKAGRTPAAAAAAATHTGALSGADAVVDGGAAPGRHPAGGGPRRDVRRRGDRRPLPPDGPGRGSRS